MSPDQMRDNYSSDEEGEESKQQERKYKDGDLSVFRDIVNEENNQ